MNVMGLYQTSILDSSHFLNEWMGVCACVIIGVGNYRVSYGIWSVLERRKYTEFYNCVSIEILGSYVGGVLGFSIGDSIGW